MEARLAKIRAKEKAQKAKFIKGGQDQKRRKLDSATTKAVAQDDEEFMLDDYDSDQEIAARSKNDDTAEGLSAGTLALMDKLGMVIKPRQDGDEEDDEMKVSL